MKVFHLQVEHAGLWVHKILLDESEEGAKRRAIKEDPVWSRSQVCNGNVMVLTGNPHVYLYEGELTVIWTASKPQVQGGVLELSA